MNNTRSAYVDYQQRASEFEVGDRVYPFMSGNTANLGRVVAVYPAIGMVDVEWPHGSERFPVEELQIYKPMDDGHEEDAIPPSEENNNVPGESPLTRKVAEAYVKKALYWTARDRHFRATQGELDSGVFMCPRCKTITLQAASYQRTQGTSEKLLGCPGCLFLVKKCDIVGHADYVDDSAVVLGA